METISCHSNQSSYPTGIKKQLFVPPICRHYVGNMETIGHTAPEEMSFENVDGRTTDGQTEAGWMPVYTISSPMSLRLR